MRRPGRASRASGCRRRGIGRAFGCAGRGYAALCTRCSRARSPWPHTWEPQRGAATSCCSVTRPCPRCSILSVCHRARTLEFSSLRAMRVMRWWECSQVIGRPVCPRFVHIVVGASQFLLDGARWLRDSCFVLPWLRWRCIVGESFCECDGCGFGENAQLLACRRLLVTGPPR